MKILELFAGSRSFGSVAEERGHEVFSVDNVGFEGIDLVEDIEHLSSEQIPWTPDVTWGSPPCFASTELVLTLRGHIPIKDVRVGDKVLTHKGRWKRVTNIGKKNAKTIKKLKGHGVDSIRCTHNHPFLVRDKDCKSTRKSGEPIMNIKWSSPYWEEAQNIEGKYWAVRSSVEKVDSYYMLDPYTIGRWIGDGWCNVSRGEVSISCSREETSDLNFLSQYGFRLQKGRTCNRYDLNDGNVSHFLYSNFRSGAKNKRIPGWVYGENKDFRERLLNGYFDADGSYGFNGNTPSVSASSVSRPLIYGIALLGRSVGYSVNIIEETVNDEAIIEGRTVKQSRRWTIKLGKGEKVANFFNEFSDGMSYSKVKSVESHSHNTYVYDLEVEDDHSYTVNNIVVHNCTTYSIAAISKHRDKGKPKTEFAEKSDNLVKNTLQLVDKFGCLFFIENPVGYLRKMPFMQHLDRVKVTYCSYGDIRMKPTDIFSNHIGSLLNATGWSPKPPCYNGNPNCHHQSAPRGSKTGTQGLKGNYERSKIPSELCEEILYSCELYYRSTSN